MCLSRNNVPLTQDNPKVLVTIYRCRQMRDSLLAGGGWVKPDGQVSYTTNFLMDIPTSRSQGWNICMDVSLEKDVEKKSCDLGESWSPLGVSGFLEDRLWVSKFESMPGLSVWCVESHSHQSPWEVGYMRIQRENVSQQETAIWFRGIFLYCHIQMCVGLISQDRRLYGFIIPLWQLQILSRKRQMSF